jgi:hypothetical protein
MDADWRPLRLQNDDVVTIGLSVDVIPYYIDRCDLSTLIDDWIIIGNNYLHHPGTYPHVNSCGHYTVFAGPKNQAWVKNSPSGTSNGYLHQLRTMLRCDKVVQLGFDVAFLKFHHGPIA